MIRRTQQVEVAQAEVEQAQETQETTILENEVEHDALLWWKKTGGGSFRLKGRIIKPGERFKARPSDIPKGFRDVIRPLGTIVDPPTPAGYIPGAKPIYTAEISTKRIMLIHGRGKSWDVFEGETKINEKPVPKADAEALLGFDILNPEGKVMNEKVQTREKADAILKSLNS